MSKTKRASSPKKAAPKKATNLRDIHPKTLKALNLMCQARHDVLCQYMTIVRKDILSRLSDMEDRSESRIPAPAEAKEEKWVPKVGELAVYDGICGKVEAKTTNVGDWWNIFGRWVPTHKLSEPSPAEISAHKLKIQEAAKKAAEEVELAKPIAFSTPIVYRDREGVFMWKEGANAYKLALSPTDTHSGQTVVAIRSEFTVLTD